MGIHALINEARDMEESDARLLIEEMQRGRCKDPAAEWPRAWERIGYHRALRHQLTAEARILEPLYDERNLANYPPGHILHDLAARDIAKRATQPPPEWM